MKQELIFLGPPACGKGTQTSKLAKYLGFPHIDTGSLLRAEIAKESEEGKIANLLLLDQNFQLKKVILQGKTLTE